jgi:uncharacterized lipoprotein YmbA
MKTTLALIALTLASCSTPEKNARLGQLVNLAVSVAEARGSITAQDAADIRAAETIILPSTTIETTSGK